MKKIIIGAIGFGILFSMSSCKKRFEELNENPNSAVAVPSQMVLPSIMLNSAYNVQLNAGLVITDLWVQHGKATVYIDEDTYNARNDRMDAIWRGLYAGPFMDANRVIQMAESEKKPNTQAIAMVMKAYVAYNLTALYGDIPYTQAGKADMADGTVTPVYDNQKDVLYALITDLNTAVGKMDNSADEISKYNLAGYDVIYHGNMDNWKKFANSLKARIYLTLKTAGENVDAELNSLVNGTDVFTSSAEEAKLMYNESTLTNENPVTQWITNDGRSADFRISETFVNFLIGSGNDSTPADPRLAIYADKTEDGLYVGGVNGLYGGLGCSYLGAGYYTAQSPFYLMSYSEILFIKAELNPTQANYEAAVSAAFEQVGLTAADALSTLADPAFAFDANKAAELVGQQKWVSLFGQGVEAFTSWRRSGFPKLAPAMNAATANSKIPRRIKYHSDEQVLNKTNVEAASAHLSPATDQISSRVWFEKNHDENWGHK